AILERLEKLSVPEFIVLAALISGKNILLVGPPGSGKTGFIRDLLDKLGVSYSIETGNPEWTPYDTIGGSDIRGEFREGFITRAVRECVSRLSEKGLPHWLIIDEINRANVDLAFGKFFTLMDVEYREKESLISKEMSKKEEVYVPYSFRVLATMNSVDRALLYKLGYALTRRFAIINHNQLKRLNKPDELYESRLESYRETCALEELDMDKIKKVLRLKKDEIKDYAVILEDVYDRLDALESLLRLENTDLGGVLTCIVNKINESLRDYTECEACPVTITPGVVADALRFVAVAKALYDMIPEGIGVKRVVERSKLPSLLLDLALALYILPQLDVLADYVKMEKYRAAGGSGKRLADLLDSVEREIENRGLKISVELVERIKRGFHTF
ncbi:MAG: AAA family ATPase, partial [Sulfolobales archaeon]